ncbi:aldose 1-epimerase [Subtercola boreus]|uniref:Aldose 1-epimerase n=1 Tax=Subtercola boreus TaxID=120213 RepID=A0A3E0WEV7_9MICO|nr:aldose 1-epimerase [Subtercola boreus]RFA23224.1 hypothetical protein B7R24_02240 [Subtercola boreus]RFA23297.1 hypothetical protein B7R23_02230 [Subtercola boreus]RFA29100.1 hypothetical protein B7R25_02245 [Subtercola boreus]
MSFTITETHFDNLPSLTVTDGSTRVVLTMRGATVISWVVNDVDLIDGYADEVEFLAQAGMRSAIMIPFSNRIDKGRYVFEGQTIDFHTEDRRHVGETVMHGLLRLEDFTITGNEVSDVSAIIHLACRALRSGAFAGYPFFVDVTIDLTITRSSIDFVVTGHNLGDTAAPFATGWHPYFTIGAAPISELIVTVPAETRVIPDSNLIPLEGDRAFERVSGEWDFRNARPIGSQFIDMAFSDLVPAADGLIHSTISDPDTGRAIDVWQDRGLLHLFTADSVPRPRGSFAMEPVEVMTNSVNRPDQADAVMLVPGGRRAFRFGARTFFN